VTPSASDTTTPVTTTPTETTESSPVTSLVTTPDEDSSESKMKEENIISSTSSGNASGKLTDMQGMLMKVILSHGGVATFEQISDSVLKVDLFFFNYFL
jgi:hypothetical protein